MEYYKEFFSLEDIEKRFEEYCQKYNIDDLALINRFLVTREFEYGTFSERCKNGVIPAVQDFIEFHQPVVFKIRDRERECDIIEIRLTDIGWKFYCPDWNIGKSSVY